MGLSGRKRRFDPSSERIFGDVQGLGAKEFPILALSLLLAGAACLPLGSHITAQASAAQVRACGMRAGGTGIVERVIDGETVVLRDRRRVRLISAATPKPPPSLKPPATWTFARRAKAALSALVMNKTVELRFGGRQKDRYGRMLAHLFVKDGGTWVQANMVSRGLARAYSFADNRKCIGRLLVLEDRARARGLGFWRAPYYRVRQAASTGKLSAAVNTFQLVEGRVHNVSFIRKRVFINFGKDWRSDFTIVIEPRRVKLFGAARQALLSLKGKRLRARGWLIERNGPAMVATHPGQIEILGE